MINEIAFGFCLGYTIAAIQDRNYRLAAVCLAFALINVPFMVIG